MMPTPETARQRSARVRQENTRRRKQKLRDAYARRAGQQPKEQLLAELAEEFCVSVSTVKAVLFACPPHERQQRIIDAYARRFIGASSVEEQSREVLLPALALELGLPEQAIARVVYPTGRGGRL